MQQLQHYIPRFLLKRFAKDSTGRVAVFDKHTSRSFERVANRIGAENRMYDFEFGGFPMTLENSLSELETLASQHIANIVRDERLHVEDSEERIVLATFLIVQKFRTRATLTTLRDWSDRFRDYLQKKEGMPGEFFREDPRLGDVENGWRAKHVRMICTAPTDFAPHLLDKDWVLLRTTKEHPFVIGDQPFTMFNEIDHWPRGSLGLRVKGIQINFPLSPTLALSLSCKSILDEARSALSRLESLAKRDLRAALQFSDISKVTKPIMDALEKGTPIESLPVNVEHFNSLQISSAERFVFSGVDDFELAKEMIASNDELRRGSRMTEATSKF